MDGNILLERLNRLSGIKDPKKDIHPLTYSQFPGTHCPLMGAAMAIRGIGGAYMMVIGTDECSYYTKRMTIHYPEWGGLDGRCVSVTIDQNDITFGCVPKVEKAFEELIEERNPRAVYLVTTCVPEIIGDDFDSCADEMTAKYNIPVMAVHTEHFKCGNHLPGVERTLESSIRLMEPAAVGDCVNILGQRMGRIESTEMYRVLTDAGVKMGTMLPGGCSVDDLRHAPDAKVNIVVNDTGLLLAKKMQKKFGTPYVMFDKYVDPDHIFEAYKSVFEYMNIDLPEEVLRLKEQSDKAVEVSKDILNGVSFIYGNSPFNCFEVCAFLTEMGMTPELIQCHSIGENDLHYIDIIRENADPYITESANIAPLQYIYDVLKPMIYLGHEYADRLRKRKIAVLSTDLGGALLGFEVTSYFLDEMKRTASDALAMRKGDTV